MKRKLCGRIAGLVLLLRLNLAEFKAFRGSKMLLVEG